MLWFKHDVDSSRDAKISKLILRYGAEGYAIYFHCIELIAGSVTNENITFELEHDSEVIADNLKIKSTESISAIDKVNEIMKFIISLNLFEESEGRIFCFKLAQRIDSSLIKNSQLRDIKKKIQEDSRINEKIQEKSCQIRLDKIRTEEIREDKIIKEKKKTSSPESNQLAQLLYNEIMKDGSGPTQYKNKAPKLDGWSKDIYKLLVIDGVGERKIREVILFATKDSFWRSNVLSGAKLRKNFATLEIQCQTKQKPVIDREATAALVEKMKNKPKVFI